ncbi:Outer membrane protein/peptidoglycan-associated(Lipo)protein [Pseudomonas sp. 9Ag]|jgi:outer membrane protein OmpA-like peptidoglycan-associated protein|uniref:Outer membrane protein OmpA-like peptidoglycan-associated protein n=2 Tax=Pseudomonadales TaxID=72274 RepID=A0A5S5BFK0_STUST|nr:outer membrane protein OmpA-like peptidoglycan-associated protein [Stutzerimonas stutzeri]VXC86542.1 Outer membrane protein/peptidoglycan-associated(Lipo)protein [Pseudomonas sp. 9Ag]
MSSLRTAVPVIVMTTFLAGCAGVQKQDWPSCAAVGGVTGAALGAIESSTYTGYGALIGGGMAAAYCWANGTEQETVAVVETVEPAPMAEPEPEPVMEAVRVELDVKFDFDKATIRQDAYDDIEVLADFMKQYDQTSTTVEGHTDSIGTDAYNQRLSMQRAESVRDALVNRYGVEANRLEAVGYGESRPVADNSTELGRAINRRVEASVEARP